MARYTCSLIYSAFKIHGVGKTLYAARLDAQRQIEQMFGTKVLGLTKFGGFSVKFDEPQGLDIDVEVTIEE